MKYLQEEKRKKLNIVFSTTRQWNPGDEFILRGVLQIFKRLNIPFTPFIYNRNPDIRSAKISPLRGFPLTEDMISPKEQEAESIFKLGMYDNSIKPDSDLSFIDLVVFAGTPEWCNNERVYDLYRMIVRDQIPVMYLGVGAPAKCYHEFYCEVIKRASLISVRQKSLLDILMQKIEPRHQPVYLSCPALLSADVEKEKNISFVECIGLIYQGSRREINSSSGVSQAFYESEIRFFQQIIDSYGTKKEIIVICHYIDEVRLAMRDFPQLEVCYSYDSADYYDIYRRCDIVVGSRVHGIGIAASLAIPGLALAHDLRGDTCEGFGAEICLGKEGANLKDGFDRFQLVMTSIATRSRHLKVLKQEQMEQFMKYVSDALTECIGKKIPYPVINTYNQTPSFAKIIDSSDICYLLNKYTDSFLTGKIYFDNGHGFSESATIPVKIQSGIMDEDVFLSEDIQRIRFDPGEGCNGVVSDLQIMLDGEQLIPQWSNGIYSFGRYYFFMDDPQIEIPVLRGHSNQITIRAKISPLTIEMLKSLMEEAETARVGAQAELGALKSLMEETEAARAGVQAELDTLKSLMEEMEAAQARTQAELDARNIDYDNIRRSVSFRVGRVLTWAPRKLRSFFRRKFIIYNYFDDLENRIEVCASRFPDSPKKTALRMIWWNFKSLFKHQVLCRSDAGQEDDLGLSDERLNVAFHFRGGLGDHLLGANYMYCFQEKFGCPEMWTDVYYARSSAVAVFEPGATCDRMFPERERIPEGYDLYIRVDRFPQILRAKKEKIRQMCPELLPYLEMCEEFYHDNRELIDDVPFRDGEISEAGARTGITRLEQPDIGRALGIKKYFSMPMFIHGDENTYLYSVGLGGNPFITLHRGTDEQNAGDVVKLWSQESYHMLIHRLKKEYPRYQLVQIGINDKRCSPMDGIDVNLVGKTSIDEIKILLRNAALHIDCEGGFAHLREALHGGPSAILFGPTNMAYFGYADNVNIRGDGCGEPCEWKTRDWMIRCVRGFKNPPCMASITPDLVMEKLHSVL